MAEITDLLPARSVEDILAERVRLAVGGREFILPSLNLDDTDDWLNQINGEVAGLLASVNDDADLGSLLVQLQARQDGLLDLLIAYDKTNVLPERDQLRKGLTPLGHIKAVLEVWRAANPLVDIALSGLSTSGLATIASPKPTSSPPRNGTGRRAKSGAN
jgi:hypothetical protein